MDLVFVLVIVGLYASTHWLVWAVSRLRGLE
jgi:hypothetical protein